jgi:hypothetical protein
MTAVGVMPMPANFSYRDVFLRGKPRHDRYDPFRIRHPAMDTGHRAKIFAPFDALKGFGEAVAAKNVLYRQRTELEQEEREELDRRLRILRDLTRNSALARRNRVTVSVTWFRSCADAGSESYGTGGQYVTVTGVCMGVDAEVTRTIRIDDMRIDLEDVLLIEGPAELFR